MGVHETDNLVRLPVGAAPVIGLLDRCSPGRPTVVPVICARQLMGMNCPAGETDGVVVIITPENQREQALCGLRVDDVIGVLDVAEASIQPMPEGLRTSAPCLDSVGRVQADGSEQGGVLLQMLRPLVLAALACAAVVVAGVAEEVGERQVVAVHQAGAGEGVVPGQRAHGGEFAVASATGTFRSVLVDQDQHLGLEFGQATGGAHAVHPGRRRRLLYRGGSGAWRLRGCWRRVRTRGCGQRGRRAVLFTAASGSQRGEQEARSEAGTEAGAVLHLCSIVHLACAL